MALPHSPKDHRNTQALPRRQHGDTVGRDLKYPADKIQKQYPIMCPKYGRSTKPVSWQTIISDVIFCKLYDISRLREVCPSVYCREEETIDDNVSLDEKRNL